ncbi:uncharacterized protein LOC119721851 [Patiria miniata]|uniref:Uncharacterized protein n=1 Tax=Patiria miniata TaxID=46514 RepID=A0A913Z7R2_PATMI|nr:uncharacterized protein LOC119721851 [Patiria miniata]
MSIQSYRLTSRHFEAPVERLEFAFSTVAPLATLHLKNADGLQLYTIELHPNTGTLQLSNHDGSADDFEQIVGEDGNFPPRLWVTYNNCEIKVGVHRSSDPRVSLQQDAASEPREIWIIDLSADVYWQIFKPCPSFNIPPR